MYSTWILYCWSIRSSTTKIPIPFYYGWAIGCGTFISKIRHIAKSYWCKIRSNSKRLRPKRNPEIATWWLMHVYCINISNIGSWCYTYRSCNWSSIRLSIYIPLIRVRVGWIWRRCNKSGWISKTEWWIVTGNRGTRKIPIGPAAVSTQCTICICNNNIKCLTNIFGQVNPNRCPWFISDNIRYSITGCRTAGIIKSGKNPSIKICCIFLMAARNCITFRIENVNLSIMSFQRKMYSRVFFNEVSISLNKICILGSFIEGES